MIVPDQWWTAAISLEGKQFADVGTVNTVGPTVAVRILMLRDNVTRS